MGPRDEPPVAPTWEGQVPQQDEPHPPGLRRRHRAHGDRRGLLEQRGLHRRAGHRRGDRQYLEEFPLEEKDKIVWKMSDADRSGPDTSALLHGVSTEQVNTIEGPFM